MRGAIVRWGSSTGFAREREINSNAMKKIALLFVTTLISICALARPYMDVLSIRRVVNTPSMGIATLEGKLMGWCPTDNFYLATFNTWQIEDCTVRYRILSEDFRFNGALISCCYDLNVVCHDGKCELVLTNIIPYGSWEYPMQDKTSYYGSFKASKKRKQAAIMRTYMEKRADALCNSLNLFLNGEAAAKMIFEED